MTGTGRKGLLARVGVRVPRFTPATAVAFVALFLALAGGSWAATRIASRSAVKVRCSASQGHKKIKCSVAPAGGGATTLTQLPGWFVISGLGAPDVLQGGELYFWNIDNFNGSATSGTATIGTYLLSPSRIAGATARLASIQFCYADDTTRDPSSSTALTITNATVVENDEPKVHTTLSNAQYSAPPYSSDDLIDSSLSLTGESDCQTVSARTPMKINAAGYLELELTVKSKLAADNGSAPQVTLELGRVTATYS